MTTNAKELSGPQFIKLARNALLVAGHEMGEQGDHWPVIKSTIHSVVQDYEADQINRNVDAEMKTHLYQQLEIMEGEMAKSSGAIKAEFGPKLKELREIYDAYFAPAPIDLATIPAEEIPLHARRAKAIIDTLQGDEDER